MKKKCYYLEEELSARLKEYCVRYGLKEAQVVRMALHVFIRNNAELLKRDAQRA